MIQERGNKLHRNGHGMIGNIRIYRGIGVWFCIYKGVWMTALVFFVC